MFSFGLKDMDNLQQNFTYDNNITQLKKTHAQNASTFSSVHINQHAHSHAVLLILWQISG